MPESARNGAHETQWIAVLHKRLLVLRAMEHVEGLRGLLRGSHAIL